MIQIFIAVIAAPLVSGIIRKIKNNLRMRRGAPILQPYYNLAKLFKKEEVVSENASWIFRIAPVIVLASVLTAFVPVPIFSAPGPFAYAGDILLVIFMLALGRFFLALAGMDSGSAFGGMGSSREMFISSLVEPVMLLSVFCVSLNSGSTSPAAIAASHTVRFSTVIAASAFFMATIAETSRIPVDNQETHLELTMVHEAMVLEYSGRSLALIEIASHAKQMLFFIIIANLIFPSGGGALALILKIAVISVAISVIEISVAKMRLFRVVDFMAFALALSIMAMAASAVGI